MIFSRKYNLVNNLTGWGIFVIALITYWLTLEPTASYWDCGEFIIQADKLEIGHPPGNPIFMLTARFFANFAFGDASKVALMVNAMSGLLSALTILLLFWTVTHLVRRLIVKDNAKELSLSQYLVVMGSGVCGALAYAWSDTFWFSAVEGEVYAFSSFCTALVFWLILKWENRADQPHSDRYLILIAYIIGVSIAVHLLNLLCIPAIILVYSCRKFSDMNVKKSLIALLVGFAIIVLVLYGLVPGFIEMAGYFELFAVNTLHLPFNTGMLIYTLIAVGAMVWGLYELYIQRTALRIRISFLLAVLISGMLFIGSGIWLGIILFIALAGVLFFVFKNNLPVRWLNIALWSIAVIFVGYSSYALILIRSNAATPMNQNEPDNVFALSSYLNREQYGDTPLLYGYTFESQPQMSTSYYDNPDYPGVTEQNKTPIYEKGNAKYAKGVAGAEVYSSEGFLSNGEIERTSSLEERGGDYYALYDYESKPVMNPELNILLPRIYSNVPSHKAAYTLWVPDLYEEADLVDIYSVDEQGDEVPLLSSDYAMDNNGDYLRNEEGLPYHERATAHKPTFKQNMQYFFNYQLNHMYWRYFLWNFAGRQNDILNQFGEKDAGNWISGIPFIDNARLGDQSLLPPELGKENKGHNVFYMLPLLLGILGLLWQAFRGKRGIEQFWVVFFLFFMTGIAIVLYLNQPPMQPRERDYAFAGSFYAFAIWIGMGVAAVSALLKLLFEKTGVSVELISVINEKKKEEKRTQLTANGRLLAAVGAFVIGVAVPLQMVSQTWDDHDRSGRYAARDYAINYLNSLEPNAIVFCNGDNDTFPLWYAQEVEGVRPDVKIINLSYLGSDWYANQQRLQTYEAAPVSFTARPEDIAYERRSLVYAMQSTDFYSEIPLVDALKEIYSDEAMNVEKDLNAPVIPHANTYIEIDEKAVRQQGLVPDDVVPLDRIPVQLNSMTMGQLLMLDIIATNAAEGWKRPIYWASTVGTDNYEQFLPYVRYTGMAYQLVPYQADGKTDTEITYKIVNKYLWGGADNYDNPPYFDETAGRMLAATRMSVLELAKSLVLEGTLLMNDSVVTPQAQRKFDMAIKVLNLFDKRLAGNARPMSFSDYYTLGTSYCTLGETLKDKKLMDRGLSVLADALERYAINVKYADDLADRWGLKKDSNGRLVGLEVQTTLENASILFSYIDIVMVYNTFSSIANHDFDKNKCPEDELYGTSLTAATKKVLKDAGISDNLLKRLYSYTAEYNQESGYEDGYDTGAYSVSDYADELARLAQIVVEMQGLTPQDYAAASEMERGVDSVFVVALQQFMSIGGSLEDLQQYDIFEKVDFERSQRLHDEYIKAHPEVQEMLQ